MTTSVVLYARSSKDENDRSCPAQLEAMRAYCAQRGYQVVAEVEEVVSANSDVRKMEALIEAANDPQRGWTKIIAYDSSRFTRLVALYKKWTYVLWENRCALEFSSRPPTGNRQADGLVEDFEQRAAEEHARISRDKGVMGLRFRLEQGFRAGGRAPFGYKIRKIPTGRFSKRDPEKELTNTLLVPDENAPKLRTYLQARAKGIRRVEAAKQAALSAMKNTTLIGIERNALTYAGITVWNRMPNRKTRTKFEREKLLHTRYRPREEWVLQKNTHEALISEAEAEKVMALSWPDPKRARKLSEPTGRFLLTGFMFTPAGERFVGDGKYYRTASKGRRIPAELLDMVVMHQIEDDTAGREFIDKFVASARATAKQLRTAPPELKERRKAISLALANLLKIAEQAPDSPTLAGRIGELEAEGAKIDAELASVDESQRAADWLAVCTPQDLGEWLMNFNPGASVDEQRAALAHLIERVEFDPQTGIGRIHYRIAFPLSDGTIQTDQEAHDSLAEVKRILGKPKRGAEVASPRRRAFRPSHLSARLTGASWQVPLRYGSRSASPASR